MSAGDAIALVAPASDSMDIKQLYRLRFDTRANAEQFRRAAELPGLSDAWRNDFRQLATSQQGA